MYEFMVGLAMGLATIWFRTSPTCDAACQVEPPPPTKPLAIPVPTRLKGIPELAHFWD
jgi:hypothetical protein